MTKVEFLRTERKNICEQLKGSIYQMTKEKTRYIFAYQPSDMRYTGVTLMLFLNPKQEDIGEFIKPTEVVVTKITADTIFASVVSGDIVSPYGEHSHQIVIDNAHQIQSINMIEDTEMPIFSFGENDVRMIHDNEMVKFCDQGSRIQNLSLNEIYDFFSPMIGEDKIVNESIDLFKRILDAIDNRHPGTHIDDHYLQLYANLRDINDPITDSSKRYYIQVPAAAPILANIDNTYCLELIEECLVATINEFKAYTDLVLQKARSGGRTTNFYINLDRKKLVALIEECKVQLKEIRNVLKTN